MPELPEVETIRRQLHERLAGRTISRIVMFKTGREHPAGEAFARKVVGNRLSGVERRAKLLIFRFIDGGAMVGHLKMTGKFVFVDSAYQLTKHDRILFLFNDDSALVWSDIRMFGYVHILSAEEVDKVCSKYGREPLASSAPELADRLIGPKTRRVKSALLDQAAIAGVGNIYADEACHRSGLRPTRRLGTLSANDRLRLVVEVQKVLNESLAQKGTSASDYVDTDGKRGGFLAFLKVYGRDGEPCRTCSTPIKKIVLGGRGTHYCPSCQK